MVAHVLHKVSFWAMTLLAMFLFATTCVYWSFRPDVNFLLTKQDLVGNIVWRTAFYIHILGGMLCIATGPVQLWRFVRERYPALHRVLGRVYVLAVLGIAAPSGLYMAFYANGGMPAGLGFIGMSVLWFYTTWKGVQTIRRGEVANHRVWMCRSFAMTFSAVTLRLWVPLLSLGTDLEPATIIVLTAWISWLFNMLVLEGVFFIKNIKTVYYEKYV